MKSANSEMPALEYSRWKTRGSVLLLAALCVAVYWQVHSFNYFNVDDNLYVYGNAHVTGPLNLDTVKWAITHTFVMMYDPLTFLAHSVNVHLFGTNPAGHHVMNALWHALDAILLFCVLVRATGFIGRSFVVAALFAVHPVNVENVAWVSELKTLLGTAFFLLALGAYGWYARRPARTRMLVVALFYGMALLAKSQVITFPFVLLLWDYWPLGRIGREAAGPVDKVEVSGGKQFLTLVKEKTLLFVITVGDAVLTSFAEHKGAQPYTFLLRLGNAILCYVRYIGKAFWPVNLAYMYPHPGYGLHWAAVWAALPVLIAITAVVIAWREKRYLLVGWFWFLGTLFPMIGLVQIDAPAMADRYAYISNIGLFIMTCWTVSEWASRYRFSKILLPVVSATAVIVLSVLTYIQAGYWKDSLSIWSRSERVTEHNWIAEQNLGALLQAQGDFEDALSYWLLAVQNKPGNVGVNLNTAMLEQQMGKYAAAVHHYRAVLAISKDASLNAQVWANLGHAYSSLGDVDQARSCYRTAQNIHPEPSPSADENRIHWQDDWWNDIIRLVRQHLHLRT
jgi:tetratricopeptide (TPR) repeat protein